LASLRGKIRLVGASTFTCRRDDIHDCLRCPRIVAFKVQRLKTREVTMPRRYVSSLTPFEKGVVGETIAKVAFEKMGAERVEREKIDEGEILSQMKEKLSRFQTDLKMYRLKPFSLNF